MRSKQYETPLRNLSTQGHLSHEDIKKLAKEIGIFNESATSNNFEVFKALSFFDINEKESKKELLLKNEEFIGCLFDFIERSIEEINLEEGASKKISFALDIAKRDAEGNLTGDSFWSSLLLKIESDKKNGWMISSSYCDSMNQVFGSYPKALDEIFDAFEYAISNGDFEEIPTNPDSVSQAKLLSLSPLKCSFEKTRAVIGSINKSKNQDAKLFYESSGYYSLFNCVTMFSVDQILSKTPEKIEWKSSKINAAEFALKAKEFLQQDLNQDEEALPPPTSLRREISPDLRTVEFSYPSSLVKQDSEQKRDSLLEETFSSLKDSGYQEVSRNLFSTFDSAVEKKESEAVLDGSQIADIKKQIDQEDVYLSSSEPKQTLSTHQAFNQKDNSEAGSQNSETDFYANETLSNIDDVSQESSGDELIINAQSFDGDMSLHEALTGEITKGKKKLIKFLIDNGADLNAQNSNGDTALHQVLKGNITEEKEKVIKLFIENGSDPTIENKQGKTAIQCFLEENKDDVSLSFLGCRIVRVALKSQLKTLKKLDKQPSSSFEEKNSDFNSHSKEIGFKESYCLSSNKKINELFFDLSKAKANADSKEESPDLVYSPIKFSIAPNSTALGAISSGVIKKSNAPFKASLDSIGEDNEEYKEVAKDNLVEISLLNDEKESQKELIDLYAAAKLGDVDSVKSGVEKGFDVNAQDSNGDTLLHKALKNEITEKTIELIRFLIEKGADPTIENQEGKLENEEGKTPSLCFFERHETLIDKNEEFPLGVEVCSIIGQGFKREASKAGIVLEGFDNAISQEMSKTSFAEACDQISDLEISIKTQKDKINLSDNSSSANNDYDDASDTIVENSINVSDFESIPIALSPILEGSRKSSLSSDQSHSALSSPRSSKFTLTPRYDEKKSEGVEVSPVDPSNSSDELSPGQLDEKKYEEPKDSPVNQSNLPDEVSLAEVQIEENIERLPLSNPESVDFESDLISSNALSTFSGSGSEGDKEKLESNVATKTKSQKPSEVKRLSSEKLVANTFSYKVASNEIKEAMDSKKISDDKKQLTDIQNDIEDPQPSSKCCPTGIWEFSKLWQRLTNKFSATRRSETAQDNQKNLSQR